MEGRIPCDLNDNRGKSLGRRYVPKFRVFRPGTFCFSSCSIFNPAKLQTVLHKSYFFFFELKVVELDFLYPSEGIHRRWENGYRITAMAATSDQAAFILSIPKRKVMDETQETLRTSAFPSTHVKVGLR